MSFLFINAVVFEVNKASYCIVIKKWHDFFLVKHDSVFTWKLQSDDRKLLFFDRCHQVPAVSCTSEPWISSTWRKSQLYWSVIV